MSQAYRSELNQGVTPARPGEFAPLRIGPITIDPPVVLAPMAGVTNSPFRRLCREFGPGLFVSEMITCRGLTEGNRKTELLTSFAADEWPRSLQLYGTDAKYLGEAARMLVAEDRVDHIDMNLGCPVRKITSQGGGAALPLRPRLLAELLTALVQAAGKVPVTVKYRKGIDDEHLYYLETGRIAMEAGVVAVGLHARTASQLYDGDADWNAIAELKASLPIPVLGNGDIFEGFDAMRMMRQTGCDGVVIGRGVLGRPWLFRDLAHLFRGEEPPEPPNLGEVAETALRHGRELVAFFGEHLGVRHMRRHGAWYTKGFPGTAELRKSLNRATTFDEVEALFRAVDPDQPFPAGSVRARRGKSAGTQKVSLPPNILK